MRGEDHGVPALQGIDDHRDHGDDWIGHGQKPGNHTRGLGVFDNPFFRDLLDYSYTLLAERIPENTDDFETPGLATVRVSQPALFDTHFREGDEGLLVGGGPSDGATEVVHLGLIV